MQPLEFAEHMMFEKVVQRVPVRPDPNSDLTGLIDLIEFELLFAGNQSARVRLSAVADEIRRSDGKDSRLALGALLDVMRRLEKIEMLLRDGTATTGSKTASG